MAVADRDLLFGLLALQNAMVSRDQLVAAFGAWTGSPGRPLPDLLAEQAKLSSDERALLAALVENHLKRHGGDPERSLAVLDLNRSTRDGLVAAGWPAVEASLARVGSAPTEPDPDRTATYAVGTATAEGRRRTKCARSSCAGQNTPQRSSSAFRLRRTGRSYLATRRAVPPLRIETGRLASEAGVLVRGVA